MLRALLRFLSIVGIAGVTLIPVCAAADRLPAEVARELGKAGIPTSAVAVLVQDVDGRRPRIAVNAEQPMNPASVMKLLTTYAALELLGPAYTWNTEAYAASEPHDGVIEGDLYLRGSGDPDLTFERFWLLLRQLRARGVREVRGDLVLDRAAFHLRGEDRLPLDEQAWRAYNTSPDALLLNFQSLRIGLVPDPARNSVRLTAEPMLDRVDLVNRIRLGDQSSCGEWKDGLRADYPRSAVQTNEAPVAQIVLSGVFSSVCGEQEWNIGVLSSDAYLEGVFRNLWRELGGSLAGRVREAAVPASAVMLASTQSPALAEVVREINKFSNNVMARQLYLTIGLEAGHRPVQPFDVEPVLRAWLASKGLDFPELVLENGAGLSRHERISAASLGRLLQTAWASPLMPEFIASLPLAGVDGTMKKRLKQTEVAGQAHVKTGTLDGVKALAGYVRDRSGRYRVVVFLVNHPAAEQAQAALDALLLWVYAHPGQGPVRFAH